MLHYDLNTVRFNLLFKQIKGKKGAFNSIRLTSFALLRYRMNGERAVFLRRIRYRKGCSLMTPQAHVRENRDMEEMVVRAIGSTSTEDAGYKTAPFFRRL